MKRPYAINPHGAGEMLQASKRAIVTEAVITTAVASLLLNAEGAELTELRLRTPKSEIQNPKLNRTSSRGLSQVSEPVARDFQRSGANIKIAAAAGRQIKIRWAHCVPANGITSKLKPSAPKIAPTVLAA